MTSEELISLMASKWISYCECHQCGRYDYCKFRAPPHPFNPNRSLDKQCGVTESVLRNFLNSCFPLLMRCSYKEKQEFLDASFYFIDYINTTEALIGGYLNAEIVDFFGSYSPSLFGTIVTMRTKLDKVAYHLKSIPEFHTTKGYLLVEGKSEKTFVETLKGTIGWFDEIPVESYDGKGNKSSSKLLILAKKLNQTGYELYIQGDQDSKERDIFQRLINSNIVKTGNTFSFVIDFESSIPDGLLLESLKRINFLDNALLEELRINKDISEKPLIEILQETGHINIDSIKVPLAQEVARLFGEYYLWGNEDFMKSELGSFIEFIKKIP
ncbi:hypothetical protein [Methanosarcina sp. UBA411]|uniref:hypothetical protein n=1 Tax=Methanosarcina sp. UBA411 TaxID=1915589 RepID=UPI0025F03567|nr:hypothetical protein [Methanosarcina sp. UBA411]